jgi:hypothetical protein
VKCAIEGLTHYSESSGKRQQPGNALAAERSDGVAYTFRAMRLRGSVISLNSFRISLQSVQTYPAEIILRKVWASRDFYPKKLIYEYEEDCTKPQPIEQK